MPPFGSPPSPGAGGPAGPCGETRMKANSSTKQRAGFVFMEIPKWIKVKELVGFVEDPVNFVAELPLEEIVEVLKSDGWKTVSYGYDAYLDDRTPTHSMEKPLPGAGVLIRLHIRLWSNGVVIGNIHLDIPSIDSFKRLSPHEAIHDVGKAYIAYVFMRGGYDVELIYLGNVTKTNDGYAVKIYKRSDRV
jgi:hypothetical protein